MVSLSTLCYIEKDDQYLMLHRTVKKNDINKDKWIGVGGHFEKGESPEECLLREVKEETGYTLTSWKYRGIVTFLGSFLSITIRILGVIVALDQLGVSMNVIIGAMSGLGVGVALALKNNMASVASGLQILLTRPFKVGDFISIDSSYGTVLAIELTYTTLLTSDNEEVVVPNNTFLTDNMVNYTARDTLRCVLDFPCSSADILRYLPQLTACAAGCSLVLQDPPPVARVNQFQSGGQADLKLIYYCRTDQYWLTRDQVAKAVAGLFEEGTGQTEPANTGITASSCASAAGRPAAENQG